MARWQMRTTSVHGIMAATREEESWLIGIAGTVDMNWLRTTASALTAAPPYKKQLMCPHRRPMYPCLLRRANSKPGIPLRIRSSRPKRQLKGPTGTGLVVWSLDASV
jgi:hypothetical protein